ncbi:MAG: hypothetical protein K9M10_02500 [Candidatus Pacebacteria bacterium]|nr:hypothetical protein [Candidatus Paceibacterota bacterium]MCF7857326.1 hypothetical protein [Candidatus Paceibacterota bacterium]
MKGIISIGGALAVGIVVILSALYVGNTSNEASLQGSVVAAPPSTRTLIDAKDSDGDGVQDWQKALEAKAFDTIITPSSTIPVYGDDEYQSPTTLTGKFSEAFFQDYLTGKMQGVDFSDPSAFVGKAVDAIDQNTLSVRHTRLELALIPDSPEAIRDYGNQVTEIILRYSINNENEALILQRALETNDSRELDALTPIYQAYTNIIRDTLAMQVPVSLALMHLDLVNAYESILTDIGAMQVSFTDPLYSLARVRGYEDDTQSLFFALQTIGSALTAQGVAYTNDEPGAAFYLFDTP